MHTRVPDCETCNISPEMIRLQERFAALEKSIEVRDSALRAEFNLKLLYVEGDMKEFHASVEKLWKIVNSTELKIARYAGGAGVLTAIAVKLLDKVRI
jgi:hypothetical protein